jgi:polyhydroxybutyrate depolymerase
MRSYLCFFPVSLSICAPLLLCGCSSSSSPSTATASDAGDAGPGLGDYDPTPFGGSRPVKLYVPTGYTGKPAPLVILLHGYSASGAAEDLYLDLRPVAEEKNVLYAHPDGTVNPAGYRFWNATDGCCNFYGSTVDDSTYLESLVKEIGTRYSVDPKRVYFFGHSNGAFMSYRMACDHADTVAAIASLAGAMWEDPSKCKPSSPVTVLEIHGTADMTIGYDGGTTAAPDAGAGGGGVYPSATTTVGDWVTLDGCASAPDTSQPNIDIETSLPGAETKVTRWATGCRSSTQVDLWSIQGGSHVPGFAPSFAPMVFDFLLAHPKP